MITRTAAVPAPMTPANLRSPVLATGSISNRDWKLLETPVSERKHRRGPVLIETKLHPCYIGPFLTWRANCYPHLRPSPRFISTSTSARPLHDFTNISLL